MSSLLVPEITRTIDFVRMPPDDLRHSLQKQWLVTNGLGGYASGTLSGAVTWRYHGFLVAALPAPLGRTMMLTHLAESIRLASGRWRQFAGAQPAYDDDPDQKYCLSNFCLRNHVPFWTYDIDGVVLQKRICMPHLQNTVHITYSLISGSDSVHLELRPSVDFRPFEANVAKVLTANYEVRAKAGAFEIDSGDLYPPLRICIKGGESQFIYDGGSSHEIFYQRDAERGYDSLGALWSPGSFSFVLRPNAPVTLIASTEGWHTLSALEPEAAYQFEQKRRKHLLQIAHPVAREGPAAELVFAADQFVITPATRIEAAARARASGDELRSIIAGYHWFTDWGRDTMISLEGLTILTGRKTEAAWILKTFANAVKDGLIPNMFPEGKNEGLYHTADATLWLFQALHRYIVCGGDRETLVAILPVLSDIIENHLRGTHFGIGVDPQDGLLRQGQEGYQLTWMDAKVGDWVVTPRRGKAVEINALWYNALRLLAHWLSEENQHTEAERVSRHAEKARQSFNARFWNPQRDCLFDVIDGEDGTDAAIRPNQIFAISLAHPVLAEEHWKPVLETVRQKLLTPVGLRSLSSDHPGYKPKYFGDLRSRDAAYHQGTVWAWLIGPFTDAFLKVYPHDKSGARKAVCELLPHLDEGCVGSISEVFDAEPPFTDRGCIAQAWSVAELLRALIMTADQ